MKLLLSHLQNSQAPVVQLVDHCLDGGGFTGACVAGEENVGGGLALEKSHGVVQNDLLLPLIIDEGGESGLVGIDDGDDVVSIADVEHDMLGVNSIAKAVNIGAAFVIAVPNIQLLCGENRKISVPVKAFAHILRGQVCHSLQDFQLPLHLVLHLGPGLRTLSDHADVGVLVIVDDVLDIARQRSLFRAVEGGDEGGILGDGLGGAVFPAAQVVHQSGHHRIAEQRPENRQGTQPDV